MPKLSGELAQANAQALDPTSTSAVIASARGVTFDAEFRLQRLVVARDRLVEKHAAAVERVEQEAARARACRDQLLDAMSLPRGSRACGARCRAARGVPA